ncbi:hypothetical protein HCUR_00952 [Holospora curviuscula]|uniref:Uncharacterized protein n=1 Tax=Holospora curviuscula TaxID=1082868 RepID=A0A2S5R8H7_9PROT|nr:hypothetical protein HCUR_00952 [Holospora curviuscula]
MGSTLGAIEFTYGFCRGIALLGRGNVPNEYPRKPW